MYDRLDENQTDVLRMCLSHPNGGMPLYFVGMGASLLSNLMRGITLIKYTLDIMARFRSLNDF